MYSITDTLTRIKNSYRARHERLTVPFSRLRFELLTLLKEHSFIKEVAAKEKGPKKKLEITLHYNSHLPALTDFKTISKPSQRIYTAYRSVVPHTRGGIIIISTSKGLFVGPEARRNRMGGEVLCEVW